MRGACPLTGHAPTLRRGRGGGGRPAGRLLTLLRCDPGDVGDVGGNVDELLLRVVVRLLVEVRHRRSGEPHLVERDLEERALVEIAAALRPRSREGVVQVRADGAGGGGVGERVAAAAILYEQLLAGGRVGAA